MDCAIVTAASSDYFSLLQGLLGSLKSTLGGPHSLGMPMYVLDLGLEKEQLEELHDLGVKTVIPDWDIPISRKTYRERHGKTVPITPIFRVFTAQPFLPRYVPNAFLLWIDADCWVQDASAIDLYLRSAEDGSLAIALEADRCYGAPYWRLKSHVPEFIRSFGLKKGWFLARKMTANVGVFAMARDAPHWFLWQEATRRAMMKRPHERSQQMAMQHVVYVDRAPTKFLPAYCNWQSWEATPLLDEVSGMLVEPQPPYHPIGVMHNAQSDKNAVFHVRSMRGSVIERTMRFEHWHPKPAQIL